jgi:hypothetical protein
VQAFVDPDGYSRFVADRKAKFEQLVAQEKKTRERSAEEPPRLNADR